MAERAEKSHKWEGLTVSFGVHASLFLAFGLWFFLELPDPPLTDPSWGGGGTVLNIGEMYVGTGDPADLSPTTLNVSENLESAPEENQPEENASEPLANEEITPTNDPEAVPIEKEQPNDKVKTDNKVADKTDSKNTTNNTSNTTKNDQQKVDSKALFTKTGNKAGDDHNKAGDPGNPEGVDPKSLYKDGTKGDGKGGAGDGSGISIGGGIAGWAYSGNPLPVDNSQEKGTLIYKIYVSDDGIVTKVELKENRGISPTIEKLYYNQLYKLVFDPVGKVPPVTEGEVSYKINVK